MDGRGSGSRRRCFRCTTDSVDCTTELLGGDLLQFELRDDRLKGRHIKQREVISQIGVGGLDYTVRVLCKAVRCNEGL